MPSGTSKPDVSVFSKETGFEWAQDSAARGIVRIGAVTGGAVIGVGGSVTAKILGMGTPFITSLSSSVATSWTLVSSQGNTTGIQIVGMGISNEGATLRRFELRYGGTPFFRLGIGPGLPFNWNFVNGYPRATNNKALKIYINGGTTFSATVYWRKVS